MSTIETSIQGMRDAELELSSVYDMLYADESLDPRDRFKLKVIAGLVSSLTCAIIALTQATRGR